MTTYLYNGDHQRITIEGITFTNGDATELTADQDKLLKASGFGKAFLANGELTEVKAEAEKSESEKPVKPTKATAAAPATNDDK